MTQQQEQAQEQFYLVLHGMPLNIEQFYTVARAAMAWADTNYCEGMADGYKIFKGDQTSELTRMQTELANMEKEAA